MTGSGERDEARPDATDDGDLEVLLRGDVGPDERPAAGADARRADRTRCPRRPRLGPGRGGRCRSPRASRRRRPTGASRPTMTPLEAPGSIARSSAAAPATSADAADVPETVTVPPPAASVRMPSPAPRGTCRRRGWSPPSSCVGLVGARDADDPAIARRVARAARAVVAGRGDDDDVVLPCVVDRRLEGGAEARVAEATC